MNSKNIFISYLVILQVLVFDLSAGAFSVEKVESLAKRSLPFAESEVNPNSAISLAARDETMDQNSENRRITQRARRTLGGRAVASDDESSTASGGETSSSSEEDGGIVGGSEAQSPERSQTSPSLLQKDIFDRWNWKASHLTHSIGFNSLNEVIQYERWLNKKWGYIVFGTIKKEEDTLKTSVVTEQNAITFIKDETTSYSGSKKPLTLLIGGGIKSRLWQNPWLQINWGGLVLLQYVGETKSATGSSKIETGDTRKPSDYSVTETDLGERKESSALSLQLGPRIGAEIYLKWFPNVSIVADMQILMSMASKRTITTSQTSQDYDVVSGIPLTPNSNSRTITNETVNTGGAWATNKIGASNFGLTQFWGIRYSW